jgi:DNA-binding transcriptional ArsR family regulator
MARAIGHPARLRALVALQSGELCVCQITELLQLAPSTVTAHLKELRRAGLTVERKQGRWVYIGLATDAEARSWISTAIGMAADDPQLTADQELVAELRRLPVADLCRFGYRVAKQKLASRQSEPPTDNCQEEA